MVVLYGIARNLALILFGLPALVMPKVVEDARGVTVGMQNTQYRDTFRVWNLLCVSRVGHRFVLIVLELNVSQLHVRNILHIYPTDAKLTFPLVLGPDTTVALIVNRGDHLRHATEMTGSVYREEQIEGCTLATRFSISLIQPLVTMLRAAPNLIFDGPMDVILRIGFDDEKPRARCSLIKLHGIVVVLHFQFVEDRMRWITLSKLLLLLLLLLMLMLLMLLMLLHLLMLLLGMVLLMVRLLMLMLLRLRR